ncbi:MAG: CHAT domain-containing protein, partial [Cyanobacteria bacterium J06635_10]
MSKSVVINLGNGDLHRGCEQVTTQLWILGNPLPQQFVGSLPPAPNLVELYKRWQLMYLSFYDCLIFRSLDENSDEIEIIESDVTNISDVGFDSLSEHLQTDICTWLKSEEFLNIERKLRSALNPEEEIKVIIQTNDFWLRRIPWYWWDFFEDYPKAEIALFKPDYKRSTTSVLPNRTKNKVRILAVMGNSTGIDLEAENRFLKSLQDAEVEFLIKPSRQEFNSSLWNSQGWDVLFFAGHSQSKEEMGRIYINENKINNSLTLEQLEEALKAAIENGLKLAIFNSCDGLELASVLEKLSIPTTIVMREPVPNLVAQVFFKFFLEFFAQQRNSLYLSFQQARRQLQGLENKFPGASCLPVIFQNPAVEPPNWLSLGGMPPCPYRGLFAFSESNTDLFFGREMFSFNLLKAVKSKTFVAVVGPSGSG